MFNPRITCGFLYVITRHGYPPPARDTARHLAQMKSLGFATVELEGIRSEHLRDVHSIRDDIRREMDAQQLSVAYFCVVLPGLGSADPSERERNLALFELGCRTAKVLGAKGVLDNAPLLPYQFPGDIPVVRHYDEEVLMAARLPDQLSWRGHWSALTDTYRQACDVAREFGLTYVMHPCLGVLSATTDAFLYFRDAVGRDNLRFNLDTANQFAMKDNLNFSLVRLADAIDYIHLSDNRGERIEHLPIGKGRIHWNSFFETLDRIGYRGDFGIDIGGEESAIADLDQSYRDAARWLESRIGGGGAHR